MRLRHEAFTEAFCRRGEAWRPQAGCVDHDACGELHRLVATHLQHVLPCSARDAQNRRRQGHVAACALQGDLERQGGAVAVASPVRALHAAPGEHVVDVGGEQPMELAARIVVNATGLWAPALAQSTSGLPAAAQPAARFCKGNYFSLAGRAPFSRLIYPLPNRAGLGVHLTLDLGGQARFGPDVQWLADDTQDPIDYTVDPARADAFYAEVRRYWPALPDGALQPAYSGVRPKLAGPGEPAADFRIDGPAEHGVPGLVNLFGIESPGLTASLALADEVLSRLGV